jgi:hypothetical protein
VENIIGTIDAQIHRLDLIQIGALALALAAILVALLGCALIVAVRSLQRLNELRDLERDGYVRRHDLQQAILRHVAECTSEVSQLRQEIAAQELEERRKILKSIAGHLKNPSARGG